MIAALNAQDAWKVAKGEEVAPIALDADANQVARTAYAKEAKEFNTKQRIACGLLIPAILDKFNNLLPDEPTDPVPIWKNLREHFESTSPFHILQIHRQLHELNLTEREDPVEWINKRQALYNELSALGKPIEETDQCMACLCALPSSYKPLYTSLCTQVAENQLTMAKMVDHLKSYHGSGTKEKWNREGAYAADQMGQWNDNRGSGQPCGRGGRGCGKVRGKGNRGGGGASKGSKVEKTCYGCGSRGHFKSECPMHK